MRKFIGFAPLSRITALFLLALPAIANLRNAITVSEVITVDFGVFMASGDALRTGTDPYKVNITWNGVGLPNLNPPLWLPLFGCMSRYDPVVTYNLWRYCNLAIYLAVTAVLLRVYRSHFTPVRLLWILALTGLNWTLYNGQVYIVMLALVTAAWLSLQRRAFGWAAIWIGIAIALKPNFAVWSGLLLFTGNWRLGLTSLIVACLTGILPLLSYGFGVYRQWLAAVAHVTWLGSPGNASLLGLAHQIRLPQLAVPLAAGFLMTMVFLLRRHKADALTVSAAALPASLLFSPIAWHGYTLVLLPLFLSRRWSAPLLVAAGMLVLPYRIVDWWVRVAPWPLTVLGSFSLAACLLACAEIMFMAAKPSAAPSQYDPTSP